MKKPKRKKSEPKFGVGQVVTEADNKDGFLWRVREIRQNASGRYEYLEIWNWHEERYLRALTKTEIGPRRNRG